MEQKDQEIQYKVPELIRVGVFNKSKKIPALIPFSISNGVYFDTNASNIGLANKQLESISLEILNKVNHDLVNFYVFDFGIKTNFDSLSRLKLSNINVINDTTEITETLENLFQTARNINTNFLTGNIKTLSEFNTNEEIKEPYNIIVIPSFPNQFSEDDLQILYTIIKEASNCGVYSLIANNDKFLPKENTRFNERYFELSKNIKRQMINIDISKVKPALKNLDIPILVKMFNECFELDNYDYKESEVLLKSIIQKSESGNTFGENFISIPIARNGRNIVNFELGTKTDAFHCMIAGQNGTGKSTLLNSIITQIAQKYTPNEIRLHLLDYKEGVEFKIYKDHPNVETLLLDNSNIEFAIEILEKFEKEIIHRKELFNRLGSSISNIGKFNKKAEKQIPYHIIIIDEAQELFTQGYDFNKKINKILTRIAKQGRAFGIHLILCTQTFSDCKIDDSVKKQTRLRISFRLSDGSDCRAILGRENDAPLFLKRFQIVYNSENGLADKNIIANTINFDEERIEDILLLQKEKYQELIDFKINIIDTTLNIERPQKKERQQTSNSVVSVKRKLKTPSNFNDL